MISNCTFMLKHCSRAVIFSLGSRRFLSFVFCQLLEQVFTVACLETATWKHSWRSVWRDGSRLKNFFVRDLCLRLGAWTGTSWWINFWIRITFGVDELSPVNRLFLIVDRVNQFLLPSIWTCARLRFFATVLMGNFQVSAYSVNGWPATQRARRQCSDGGEPAASLVLESFQIAIWKGSSNRQILQTTKWFIGKLWKW